MSDQPGTNPFALGIGVEALLLACEVGSVHQRDGKWRGDNVRFHDSVAREAVGEGWVTPSASLTRAGEMRLRVARGRLPDGVALAVLTDGKGFRVEAAWSNEGLVERATVARADRRETCHMAVRAYNAAFPRLRAITVLRPLE